MYLFTARPRPDRARSSCTCALDPRPRRACPAWPALSFPAGRFEREMRDLFGIVPIDHPLPRRLVRHFHWPRGWYPMRRRRRRPAAVRRRRRPLPVPHRRGPGRVRDPGRPGARRHDRTRPLPLLRRRRDHPQPQGPAVVRPPRHRETLPGPRPADGHGAGRTDQRRHRRRAHPRLLPWPSRTPLGVQVRPRTSHAGAPSCWSWSACTTTSPTSARCATTSPTASSTPTPSASANNCCGSTTRSPATGCCAARSSPAAPRLRRAPRPRRVLATVAADVAEIVALALGHSVVRDRFTGTAVLTAAQAADIGTLGYVARASGLTIDARHDHPTSPTWVTPARRPPTPAATSWPGSCVRAEEIDVLRRACSTTLVAHLGTAPPDRRRCAAGAARTGPASGRRHRRGLARHDRAPRRTRRRTGR